jgi:hypothetical protein
MALGGRAGLGKSGRAARKAEMDGDLQEALF